MISASRKSSDPEHIHQGWISETSDPTEMCRRARVYNEELDEHMAAEARTQVQSFALTAVLLLGLFFGSMYITHLLGFI